LWLLVGVEVEVGILDMQVVAVAQVASAQERDCQLRLEQHIR
jgi:hypothetical protein